MSYAQYYDGEPWEIELDTEHWISCCECGLVHAWAVFPTEKPDRVKVVFVTDAKATAARRRSKTLRERIMALAERLRR